MGQYSRQFCLVLQALLPALIRNTIENMDIGKILQELREERAQLEEAILAIERLAIGRTRRRGRPPKWLAAQKASQEGPKRRGRPPGKKSAATKPVET
jgi:hypothetical protein